MTIGGIVLAVVAAISVRQQRLHADLTDRIGLAEQLRQAATVLPIELRGLAVDAGDLREGRDTAVEFRSTIASGVICDTTPGGVVLAPAATGESAFAGVLAPIAVDDTAWMFAPGDSVDRWIPFAIAGTGSIAGAACDRAGPELDAAAKTLTRISLRPAGLPSAQAIGSVVRVTRPMRYSVSRRRRPLVPRCPRLERRGESLQHDSASERSICVGSCSRPRIPILRQRRDGSRASRRKPARRRAESRGHSRAIAQHHARLQRRARKGQ